MSTSEFIQRNYDNPKKVLELFRTELKKLKNNFHRKYPNADLSKFDFEVIIHKDGTLDSSKVYFIAIPHHTSYDIETSAFKNNPEYTKYLSSN